MLEVILAEQGKEVTPGACRGTTTVRSKTLAPRIPDKQGL